MIDTIAQRDDIEGQIFEEPDVDVNALLNQLFNEGAKSTSADLGERTLINLSDERKFEVFEHLVNHALNKLQYLFHSMIPMECEGTPEADYFLEQGSIKYYKLFLLAVFQHEEMGDYVRNAIQEIFLNSHGVLPDEFLITLFVDRQYPSLVETKELEAYAVTMESVKEEWDMFIGRFITKKFIAANRQLGVMLEDENFFDNFYNTIHRFFESLSQQEKDLLARMLTSAYRDLPYFQRLRESKKDHLIDNAMLLRAHASTIFINLQNKLKEQELAKQTAAFEG